MNRFGKPIAARAWVAAALLIMTLTAPALAEEITDLAGRRVSLSAEPRRIICLGPGCLRLIVYLQAQDKVVGIEDFEKRFPQGRPYYLAQPGLGKLPSVTPGGVAAINNLPDLEGVLKVKPQAVFVTYMQREKADRLQGLLGVPVVVLSYGRFASFDRVVLDSLLLAGKILGKADRAKAVVDFLEAQQGELARRGKTARRRPGAYVGGLGFKGAHGLESTNADYLPFRWVGADNLAAKLTNNNDHLMVDKEKLLGLNPEYIFVDGGGLALVAADYAKHPDFYGNLRAFRDGRVYSLFPFNWYTTNLGTALADAYAIGKILEPEAFADVDPTARADEVYAFLVGKPVYRDMARRYGPLGGKPAFIGGGRP